jgi:hypothetical protein
MKHVSIGRVTALKMSLGTFMIVALVVFYGHGTASAQVISSPEDRYRTPQRFALELRFGPYKPDIDSEFGGKRHAYEDFFGSGRRLLSQVEFDYQILHHVGSLGVGLGVGYFTETGSNSLTDGSATVTADTTTLRLVPLSASVVYRFDLLWEQLHVPLIPYGKVGLDYVIWTLRDGNGEIPESPSGGKGQGGTLGWHAAAGLSFVLNFLDPTAARQFDAESGINRTHVFAEWGHWDVSGLGAANKLHVGDNTWVAGMLFEF